MCWRWESLVDDIEFFCRVDGWRDNLKDLGDVDEICSSNDGLFVFVVGKSCSSSHKWLNRSERTGNIRWQRLHVRNWSKSLDRPLPSNKQTQSINYWQRKKNIENETPIYNWILPNYYSKCSKTNNHMQKSLCIKS